MRENLPRCRIKNSLTPKLVAVLRRDRNFDGGCVVRVSAHRGSGHRHRRCAEWYLMSAVSATGCDPQEQSREDEKLHAARPHGLRCQPSSPREREQSKYPKWRPEGQRWKTLRARGGDCAERELYRVRGIVSREHDCGGNEGARSE